MLCYVMLYYINHIHLIAPAAGYDRGQLPKVMFPLGAPERCTHGSAHRACLSIHPSIELYYMWHVHVCMRACLSVCMYV